MIHERVQDDEEQVHFLFAEHVLVGRHECVVDADDLTVFIRPADQKSPAERIAVIVLIDLHVVSEGR